MKQTEKQSKKEKDMRSHVKQVSEGLEGMATQESKQTMIQVHFFFYRSLVAKSQYLTMVFISEPWSMIQYFSSLECW